MISTFSPLVQRSHKLALVGVVLFGLNSYAASDIQLSHNTISVCQENVSGLSAQQLSAKARFLQSCYLALNDEAKMFDEIRRDTARVNDRSIAIFTSSLMVGAGAGYYAHAGGFGNFVTEGTTVLSEVVPTTAITFSVTKLFGPHLMAQRDQRIAENFLMDLRKTLKTENGNCVASEVFIAALQNEKARIFDQDMNRNFTSILKDGLSLGVRARDITLKLFLTAQAQAEIRKAQSAWVNFNFDESETLK